MMEDAKETTPLVANLDNSTSPKLHQLVVTTFSKFTTCDHCNKFLWGVIKQGLTCQTCGYNCHPACTSQVKLLTCQPVKVDKVVLERILTPTTTPTKLSRSNSYSSGQQSDDDSGLIHELVNGNPKSNLAPPIKAKIIARPEHSISEDSAAESDYQNETGKEGLERNKVRKKVNLAMDKLNTFKPHLSKKKLPLALKRHSSQDITNSGQLLEDSEDKKSFDSIVKGVIEQANFHKRQLQSVRTQPALSILTTPQNFTKFITRITPVRKGYDKLLSILTWEYPVTTWFVLVGYILICWRPLWLVLLPHLSLWWYITTHSFDDLESDPQRDSNTSRDSSTAEYAQNMQFVQNLMGTYTEAHDFAITFWQDNKHQINLSLVLFLTGIGLPLSMLILYLIPLNFLLLMLGGLALLCNHPIVMAIVVTVSPLLVDELANHFTKARKVFHQSSLQSPDLNSGGKRVKVRVFENQRYWVMLGWRDQLLSTERPAWSDESGQTKLNPIYKIQPEAGYKWCDEGWEIVQDWADPIHPDKQGWVYTNTLWDGVTAMSRIDSFTRRRLWQRRMVPKVGRVPTPKQLLEACEEEEAFGSEQASGSF